jgi:hypothetical protein
MDEPIKSHDIDIALTLDFAGSYTFQDRSWTALMSSLSNQERLPFCREDDTFVLELTGKVKPTPMSLLKFVGLAQQARKAVWLRLSDSSSTNWHAMSKLDIRELLDQDGSRTQPIPFFLLNLVKPAAPASQPTDAQMKLSNELESKCDHLSTLITNLRIEMSKTVDRVADITGELEEVESMLSTLLNRQE